MIIININHFQYLKSVFTINPLLLPPRGSFVIVKKKFVRKCVRNVVWQNWNRNTLFLENVRMDLCVCVCVFNLQIFKRRPGIVLGQCRIFTKGLISPAERPHYFTGKALAGLLFLLDVLPCVLQSLLIGCFLLFFCGVVFFLPHQIVCFFQHRPVVFFFRHRPLILWTDSTSTPTFFCIG